MKVKFWGVRGSIPVPGPDTVRYGGNTTCIEVRTAENDLIVLDGGTGIFQLAQSLLKSLPVTAHIFNTHSHWDHIQGLPFFLPIFIPGNKIFLYSAFDPITGAGAERIMNVQMQYSFFPVREAEMKSRIEYVVAMPHETISVGEARVTPFMLNHPVVNLGYRVESGGKSLFFTGDHEPYANIYEQGDAGHEEFSRLIAEQHASVVAAIRGVDVLIADSSYTVEEYPAKKGWGHGTFDGCIELAIAAGVKVLYCTHHEPTRSDDDLERAFAAALERYSGSLNGLDVRLAREGEEMEF